MPSVSETMFTLSQIQQKGGKRHFKTLLKHIVFTRRLPLKTRISSVSERNVNPVPDTTKSAADGLHQLYVKEEYSG